MHPCTHEQPTHGKKIYTVPHNSQALHQRKRGRQRTMCHFRTNLQTQNITPAPARSATKRMGSVTTEHQAAPCSTKLHSKIETRLLQVCTQKPSFSSPPCTALFFFSAHGEKEEGGAFQQKNSNPEREGTPSPKRASLPSAQLRQTRRQHPGQAPLPEGATSCPHSGANPLGIPSVRGIRPTRGIALRSDPYISAFSRTGSTM